MERRLLAAVRAMARCLPFTRMARVLRPCIVLLTATMDLIRMAVWFYPATSCMGRRLRAAVRAMARCLPFTRMARVLRLCIPICNDGSNPYGGLVLSGNILYGTASEGGSSGNGTVFAVHTDGTGFTTLHAFTAFFDDTNNVNNDGAFPFPYDGLI